MVLLFVLSLTAFADRSTSEPAVLDFEGEVIEGERKGMDLFLQYDAGKIQLDSVLYDRKNFNDFHRVDHTRRPILIKPLDIESNKR